MKSVKAKVLISISSLISFYFILCTVLFFFEPAEYNAPDLNDFKHYLDAYSKFSEETNNGCHIKQIAIDDIAVADDERIKFIKNTVLAVAEHGYNYNDVTSLLKNYNYDICGQISDVNFYQISFNEQMSYEEILTLCDELTNTDVFRIVIPDYFEETPAEESTSEIDEDLYQKFYANANLEEAWQYFGDTQSVNIGVIDSYIDSNSQFLNIVNADEYSVEQLYSEYYYSIYSADISHGTHVAGVIGASHASDAPGVVENAPIYSYNGINTSVSYWVASLYDMIVNHNVKAINVSMGFNPYLPLSANLGCENAISFIENDRIFFSAILSNIIDNGYEFVICNSAGNDAETKVYRFFDGYFKYGDKKFLSKLDIFGIYDSKPEYVDAKYGFFFTDPPDENVADRVIVVGSVNEFNEYSNYSNTGIIDIAAPGETIYSTIIDSQYEYMSGTSMATPFVTGSAAMLFSLDDDITGAQVKEILISSATESVSVDGFTYPILNTGNAVKTLVCTDK